MIKGILLRWSGIAIAQHCASPCPGGGNRQMCRQGGFKFCPIWSTHCPMVLNIWSTHWCPMAPNLVPGAKLLFAHQPMLPGGSGGAMSRHAESNLIWFRANWCRPRKWVTKGWKNGQIRVSRPSGWYSCKCSCEIISGRECHPRVADMRCSWMQITQCTFFPHCTLHIAHCTFHIALCSLHFAHCTHCISYCNQCKDVFFISICLCVVFLLSICLCVVLFTFNVFVCCNLL